MKNFSHTPIALVALLLSACSSSSSSVLTSTSSPLISSPSSAMPITVSSESSLASSLLFSSSSSSNSWLLYETHFSTNEGFAAAEITKEYRNYGPVGQRWGLENGGIIENGLVNGSQAVILKFDPTHPNDYTTLTMGFSVTNPGMLSFEAHSSFAGVELRLGYYFKGDFALHWMSSPFEMVEGNATYAANLDIIGDIQLYFMVIAPDPLPVSIVYMTIDNLKIYPIIEENE